MSIVIREMTLDDLEMVMEIEEENFSVPWSETGFFTFLIRDDTIFLVAQEEDQIVGYCGVVMVQDEGDITNVAVAKKSQNKGIGKRLVSEMLNKTKEAGVRTLFLEVRLSNDAAIHVYEQAGFERCGMRKNYYEEPLEDALVMKHEEI